MSAGSAPRSRKLGAEDSILACAKEGPRIPRWERRGACPSASITPIATRLHDPRATDAPGVKHLIAYALASISLPGSGARAPAGRPVYLLAEGYDRIAFPPAPYLLTDLFVEASTLP